jgi:hypothetical protein
LAVKRRGVDGSLMALLEGAVAVEMVDGVVGDARVGWWVLVATMESVGWLWCRAMTRAVVARMAPVRVGMAQRVRGSFRKAKGAVVAGM